MTTQGKERYKVSQLLCKAIEHHCFGSCMSLSAFIFILDSRAVPEKQRRHFELMCSKSDRHQGARKKKKSEENGVIPKKLIKKLNDKSKSSNCSEAFESLKSVVALSKYHDRVHLLPEHHDSVHLPLLPGGETGGNRTCKNDNNKGGNPGKRGRASTSFPAAQESR